MAVKRRVIWLSDEEWAILGQVAQDNGKTISEVIRAARFVHPSAIRDATSISASDDWDAMQRNLDADIEARSPVGRTPFNSRPFTPVPKEK